MGINTQVEGFYASGKHIISMLGTKSRMRLAVDEMSKELEISLTEVFGHMDIDIDKMIQEYRIVATERIGREV